MSRTFTGPEFLKALAEGGLRPSLFRVGMVKPCDDDPAALMFAEGASCLHWVKIPLDMIGSVEHLGDARCLDHQHPRVRLHLKDTPGQNREAAVFADLLRLSPPTAAAAGWEPSEPGTPTPQGPLPGPLPHGPSDACFPSHSRCQWDRDLDGYYQWVTYRNCDSDQLPCTPRRR